MAEDQCLVCGECGFDPHLEILRRCRSCGFVTARLDAPVDTRAIYDGDYFTGDEYLDYRADEALFRKTFRRRLRRLLHHRDTGRLLEIGAAYGFFLDEAKQHFDVVGFELNSQAARHARETLGLNVRTEDFLAADLDGSFDAAVMWDVIEHLEQPDAFIARIGELAAPEGILCLTTGDIGSTVARMRGRNWRLIHPPTHLHYFDRNTIARLLDRHGFEVVDIRALGVARSIRQVLYSVVVLGLHLPGVYRGLAKLVPASWGFTLNTFDIMCVTARKRG